MVNPSGILVARWETEDKKGFVEIYDQLTVFTVRQFEGRKKIGGATLSKMGILPTKTVEDAVKSVETLFVNSQNRDYKQVL
jgi:hypothetical protein